MAFFNKMFEVKQFPTATAQFRDRSVVIPIKPATLRVRIIEATDDNWYKVGEEYEVLPAVSGDSYGDWGFEGYPIPHTSHVCIRVEDCEIIRSY